MKLQLLIPQYNETEDIVEGMLQSISTQQSVDLKNDVEVIIGNDGSDTKLSEEFIGKFPFSIKYMQFEHTSAPGTRKKLFELADADYVMFCDADDMFMTNLALYTIFAFMEKGFDLLIPNFMEELIDKRTGKHIYVPHERDTVFVHGKVYRRQFLVDNDIQWYPDIKQHEDGSYNTLALKLSKDTKYCNTSLYIWRWRDDSICRKDPLYVLKTYTRMIHSSDHMLEDFLKRDMIEEVRYYSNILLYGTYFMLNKPIWLEPLNNKYRYQTESCFSEYYKKYESYINSIDPKIRTNIIAGTKRRVLKEGVILEKFTFDSWIKYIKEI